MQMCRSTNTIVDLIGFDLHRAGSTGGMRLKRGARILFLFLLLILVFFYLGLFVRLLVLFLYFSVFVRSPS